MAGYACGMAEPTTPETEELPASRDLTRLALAATLCGVLSGIFGADLSLSLLRAVSQGAG